MAKKQINSRVSGWRDKILISEITEEGDFGKHYRL